MEAQNKERILRGNNKLMGESLPNPGFLISRFLKIPLYQVIS